MEVKRQIEPPGQVCDKLRILIRLLAPDPMVKMSHAENQPQAFLLDHKRPQQSNGVCPTRHCGRDSQARPEKPGLKLERVTLPVGHWIEADGT